MIEYVEATIGRSRQRIAGDLKRILTLLEKKIPFSNLKIDFEYKVGTCNIYFLQKFPYESGSYADKYKFKINKGAENYIIILRKSYTYLQSDSISFLIEV